MRRQTLGGEHGPIRLLAFSPSGRRLAAVGAEILIVWNLDDGSVARRVSLWRYQDRLVYLELDGREWLVIDRAIPAKVPQPPALVVEVDGDALLSPFGSEHGSRQIAVARDRLAVVRDGEPAAVWLGPEHEPLELSDAVGPVAMSTDGRIVASTGYRGEVSTWDTQTGAKLGHLRDEDTKSRSAAVALSPDGHRVAVLYDDGGGMLWDTSTGAVVAPLSSPAGLERSSTSVMTDVTSSPALAVSSITPWRPVRRPCG
ncbi:WD40 repeat domain-containing protein [Enhygromyxa salina]|nr:WD40 repeat domain-containing protein [Enhygromyxa salina]